MGEDTLPARIKLRLAQLGISARSASLMAGMGADGVRDILSGKSKRPLGENINRLAGALGCTAEYLLGNSDSPTSPPSPPPPGHRPIFELDTRAGAGGGGIDSQEMITTDGAGNLVATDATAGKWWLPEDYVSRELKVLPAKAYIVEIRGDSMSPTLLSGDRVMVDTVQRSPSPPGLFALWDGLGLVVKRIEYIPGSDPATIEIMSDNQVHRPYQRTVEEAHIVGRVVWYARKL